MEDVLVEIGKGFLRVIGYLLADIFFWTICYWVGWPVCKILTGGRYPKKSEVVYLGQKNHYGFWCAATGLVIIVSLVLFLLGAFG